MELSYFKRTGRPIFAVASGTGGPVCILRVSGENLDFLADAFGPFPAPQHFQFKKFLNKEGQVIDEGLLLYFKAPQSFTGEDVLEFQIHGFDGSIELMKRRFLELGMIEALSGEFSFRAVLNNRMSLSKAELINDAFHWDTRIPEARIGLVDLSSLSNAKTILIETLDFLYKARGRVEAAIDFPEAEAEQATEIRGAESQIKDAQTKLLELLNAFDNFRGSIETPTVLILGAPNVGKSTLLNLLVGGERAIVSEIAGTTRDFLELEIQLQDSKRIKVIDTAGLRNLGSEMGSHEKLEAIGIERALALVDKANLVLFIQKASERDSQNALLNSVKTKSNRLVQIYSFADLLESNKRTSRDFDFIHDRAVTRASILKLLESELSKSQGGAHSGTPKFLLSDRQSKAIRQAKNCLDSALHALLGLRPLELCGNDLRDAEKSIKEAIGENMGEEYIEAIFRQFCLGK